MESHQKRGKEPKSYMSPTFCASLKSKNTVMQTPLSYNNLRKQMNVDVGSQLARFSTSLKAKSTVTQTPRAYNNIRKPMNEDVCSQVARVLKDIHNKDAKMKVEALKKLSKCFKNITKEVFVQIVPIWSFAYKKLLLERNTDVRRATHDTMTSLITDVGGSLAPHLKSLMGPWWFSQFDPVSEISFQDALAAQERLGSLVLYTSEIFFYLEENLKLTPQTISDKATPMDELEEMHQHVVSSSLLALAKLVYVLVVKNGSKARAVSSAEKMFSALKYFTEFLKSESAVIRSATYSALGSFIKHIPEVVKEENLFIISAAILGSFQEKDPTCHSSMWETLLLFSKEYPESWAPASIQKTVLNQFWQFLRNGCYGTQQVACPMLVPFINTMPPESLKGNEFFLNFFQNLWVGRHTSYSSSADSLAFFKAFGECFIWAIQNASRYFDGEDAVHQFRVGLVVSILVDLMWKGFLLLDSSKSQDGVLPQKSSSGSPEQNIQSSSQGQKLEKQNTKLPLHYMQNLGECIIEILSVLSGVEHSLLSTFCTTFLENSIEFVKETEQSRSSEQVNQVVSFLVLLQKHARNKDETWPLVYLTGPMLTKVFPVIKSLESPDAVRILSLSVSIFGPRRIVSQLHNNSEEVSSGAPSKEGDNDYETKHFMQVFKETFLPWCLHQSSLSVGTRLDLLLALLDDQYFLDQWSSIITSVNSIGSDSDTIDMLAVLIEKVRREIDKNERTKYFRPGFCQEKWHHNLLDSIAINVASSSHPFPNSFSRFLRAVLGTFHFLSTDSVVIIFKELLKKLEKGSPEETRFALEIILDSLFHFKSLVGECCLVSSISVAITKCEHKLFDKRNRIKGKQERTKDENEMGKKRYCLRQRKSKEAPKDSGKYNLRIREPKKEIGENSQSTKRKKKKKKKYWCDCSKNASCRTYHCVCYAENEPCARKCGCTPDYCNNSSSD